MIAPMLDLGQIMGPLLTGTTEALIQCLGPPHEVLTHDEHGPYLEKWHLHRCPQTGWKTLLHRFVRSDAEADFLHDHPWINVSWVLSGGYWEVTTRSRRWIAPGTREVRQAEQAHRVELQDGIPAVSLFMHGPKIREWGFVHPDGRWVDFRTHTQNSGAYRELSV